MPTQVVAPHAPWSRRGRPSTADSLLIHAVAIYEADVHDRCGHPSQVCSDPEHEGRFHVEPVRCFATAATEEYAERHKDELKDASYGLTTRLLAVDEDAPADVLEYDPQRARAEWLKQREKYGLSSD